MQVASSLYPYTQSLLTKIVKFDVADTSETEQTEDKNPLLFLPSIETDSQRIVSIITTGDISLKSAKMICQLVQLFNSNTTDHLYLKRSCVALTIQPYGRLEHSVIIGPLVSSLCKTRSVFISTHNTLPLESSQKIVFKSSIRLKFDSQGRLASSKNAAKQIIKMSVKLDNLSESGLFSFKKRLFIMQKLRNSCHFPKNYAFIYKETSKTFSIYQEKAISDLITRDEKDGGLFALSDEKKLTLARSLLGAVQDMKNVGVVHRDLKLDNILCFGEDDKHIDIKVSDLGLACLESDTYSLDQMPGSLPWVAPDLVRKAFHLTSQKPDFGNKADMWPIGLIIYYMATGNTAPHQISLFSLVSNQAAQSETVMAAKMFCEIKQNPNHPDTESFFQGIPEKDPQKLMGFLQQKMRKLIQEKENLLTTWAMQISALDKLPSQISTLKDVGIAMLQDNPEDRICLEDAQALIYSFKIKIINVRAK